FWLDTRASYSMQRVCVEIQYKTGATLSPRFAKAASSALQGHYIKAGSIVVLLDAISQEEGAALLNILHFHAITDGHVTHVREAFVSGAAVHVDGNTEAGETIQSITDGGHLTFQLEPV